MKRTALAAIAMTILVASVTLSYFAIRPETRPFVMTMIPNQLRGEALAGQQIVFLVSVESQSSHEVKISAAGFSSAVLVNPITISPEQVAEVTVVPNITSVGNNITVIVKAERAGTILARSVNFTVVPGEDTLAEHARDIRDKFIQWLSFNHPELGITNQTCWAGTIVSPI